MRKPPSWFYKLKGNNQITRVSTPILALERRSKGRLIPYLWPPYSRGFSGRQHLIIEACEETDTAETLYLVRARYDTGVIPRGRNPTPRYSHNKHNYYYRPQPTVCPHKRQYYKITGNTLPCKAERQ